MPPQSRSPILDEIRNRDDPLFPHDPDELSEEELKAKVEIFKKEHPEIPAKKVDWEDPRVQASIAAGD